MGSDPEFKKWVKKTQKAARIAADDLARKQGIPDLTAAEAEEFAALGRPDMREMIGRPVGFTPDDYRDYKNPNKDDGGGNLDFIFDLLLGKHLNDEFLQDAK